MYKKVQISLVGGQVIPVYQLAKHNSPDFLVLVYSKETKEKAERISELREKGETAIIYCDPTDFKSISKTMSDILLKYKSLSEKLYIDVTGGTKPWTAYLAYYSLQEEGDVKIEYIDQNGKIWDFKTKESVQSESLDLETQLFLGKHKLSASTDFREYTEEDIEVAYELYNRWPRQRNILKRIFEGLYRQIKEDRFEVVGSKIDDTDIEYNILTQELSGEICIGRNYDEISLYSPNIERIAFNTGWFELIVGKIFMDWKLSKEVLHSCVFTYKDTEAKNEIDLIVSTQDKPIYVECKTGINNNTDIDKFNSAVKLYGGNGSKAVFVTLWPMNEKQKQKCKEYKIVTHHLLSRRNQRLSDERLYSKLEEELKVLNT